jgi:hypothetical protein
MDKAAIRFPSTVIGRPRHKDAKRQPPDAAEAVDANADGHDVSPYR